MAKVTIVIIDDQKEIGDTLVAWLTKLDYDAKAFSSGRSGLDFMAGKDIGAVLLDIKMPEEDGISVLKKIKEADPAAAVILMTAYPSDDTITQALANGAYDYMLKPFNIEKIQFLVERAISYHKLLQATRKKS